MKLLLQTTTGLFDHTDYSITAVPCQQSPPPSGSVAMYFLFDKRLARQEHICFKLATLCKPLHNEHFNPHMRSLS